MGWVQRLAAGPAQTPAGALSAVGCAPRHWAALSCLPRGGKDAMMTLWSGRSPWRNVGARSPEISGWRQRALRTTPANPDREPTSAAAQGRLLYDSRVAHTFAGIAGMRRIQARRLPR